MPRSIHLTLDSTLRDIEVLAEQVDEFAVANGLSPDDCGEIQLALEEVVSNVIKHGYRCGGKPIDVLLAVQDGQLTIVVEDCAPCFNPLEAPDPDLNKPMAEKQPGGLGIHLVKKLMTSVGYEYAGGKNRLTLCKRLTGT